MGTAAQHGGASVGEAAVIATVLIHDAHAAALRVLKSIRLQTAAVRAVVLLDNKSRRPFSDYLAARGEALSGSEVLQRSAGNHGVGAGHNRAIAIAAAMRPSLVWMLEHDSFVDADCLAALLRIRRSAVNPEQAVIIPRLARNEYERAVLDARLAAETDMPFATRARSLTFNGPLFPLSLVRQVGPVREDLFVGLEDREYARRLVRAGAAVLVSERVLGIHPNHGNGRFREPDSPARVYWAIRNEMVLLREEGERPSLPRIARVIGGAGKSLLERQPRAAYRRLLGLAHGLLHPVVPSQSRAVAARPAPRALRPGRQASPPATVGFSCRCCGEAVEAVPFQVASFRLLPEVRRYPYGECPRCRSLTLLATDDPSPFYNAGYERLRPRSLERYRPTLFTRQVGAFGRRLSATALPEFLARLAGAIAPTWVMWFQGLRVGADSPILDVGCGDGALLAHLRRFGFTRLSGVDPYLVDPERDRNGLSLRRAGLSDCEGRYQVLIFNHVVEHLDDPVQELERARARLLPGGGVVVNLPIVGGDAWRRYRDNLWSLDAPLHRFLPTPVGLESLARRAGFRVGAWQGATTPYFYLGSEMIRRNISPDQERSADVLSPALITWARRTAGSERGVRAAQATFRLVPGL